MEPPGPLSSPAPVPGDGNSSWDPSLTPGLGPCGDLGHPCRATLSSLVAPRHRDVAVLGISPVLGCPRWFWGVPGGFGVSFAPPARAVPLPPSGGSCGPCTRCPQGVPNASPPLDPTPWSVMGLGWDHHHFPKNPFGPESPSPKGFVRGKSTSDSLWMTK